MNWQFTLHNYTDEDIEQIKKLENHYNYLIFGEEIAPNMGVKHLQGNITFREKKTKNWLIKYFNKRAYYSPIRENIYCNNNYCKKDGKYYIYKR